MTNKIEGITIKGTKVGVRVQGPGQFEFKNVTFDNVEQPWEMDGRSSGSVHGTRIKNDPKLADKGQQGTTSMGWRRPKGAPLPAFCPNCKTVFASRNHVFSGASWNINDNEEPCPNCNYQHAKLADGVFDLTKEVVNVLSAPDFTFTMLAALKNIGDKLVSGSITNIEAIDQASLISSDVGSILRTALSLGNTILLTVIAIIGLYFAYTQVDLQRDANASSDKVTEKLLYALSKLEIHSDGVREKPYPTAADHPRTSPPASEAPSKGGAVELKPERRPKARDLRRKSRTDQRKCLRPRHG